MNSNVSFNGLCALAGAVVGSVVGFIVGRRRGLKKGYYDALRRYSEVNDESEEEQTESDESTEEDALEKLGDIAEAYIDIEPEEEELDIDFGGKADVIEEENESYSRPKKNKGKPYVINGAEYGEDGYEMKVVKLYRRDAKLVWDDTKEVISNWRELGPDIIQKLEIDLDVNILYVRNEQTKTDYEIEAIDDFWDDGGLEK